MRLLIMCLFLSACATQGLPHRPPGQSWDQQTLHREGKVDCPAVYDAPGGNIRFCLGLQGAARSASLNGEAVDALRSAFVMPDGQQWEYGGAIFMALGKLGHTTPPHTNHKHDSVQLDPAEMIPSGALMVAMYHTHPCMAKTHFPRYFSPPDIALAIYTGVPSYILDECSGDVLMFDSRFSNLGTSMRAVTLGPDEVPVPFTPYLVLGEVVGNIELKGRDIDKDPAQVIMGLLQKPALK